MKRPVVITLLVMALIFVCLGIGAVIFFTANGGFPTNNPFDRRNIASELEESEILKVDSEKPLTLKVASAAGDVTITGADVDTVQVTVVKTAYDSSQSRADEEVKGVKYTIEQTGNTITLKYELPESINFSNNVNTVDFVVTVPHESVVNVDTNGEAGVANIKGSVEIRNGFGDVTVKNIEGALEVGTKSGQVDASAIDAGNGNIELSSGFGNVSLEQANGKDVSLGSESGGLEMNDVRASGDVHMVTGFGDTSFNNGSANRLTIETKSGRVTLSQLNLEGILSVEDGFGEVNLEQVSATSYDLQTNSGSITVDGAHGKVKADSGFGPITIRGADQATVDLTSKSGSIDFEGSLGEGPHSIFSGFGEIHLTIPADSALDVALQTTFGSIESDIPITVTFTNEMKGDVQTGTMNGGGELLKVETGSGSISITAGQ